MAMSDYCFTRTFEVGDEVTLTRGFKAENLALLKRNRQSFQVFRGDEGVIIDVLSSTYYQDTTYTIRLSRTGTTVSGVKEFLIE